MHVSLALEPLSRGGRLKVDHHGDLLRFDSQTKHLKLFAKEKFSNDDNYVLTVRPPPAIARNPGPPPRVPASTAPPRLDRESDDSSRDFSTTSTLPPRC